MISELKIRLTLHCKIQIILPSYIQDKLAKMNYSAKLWNRSAACLALGPVLVLSSGFFHLGCQQHLSTQQKIFHLHANNMAIGDGGSKISEKLNIWVLKSHTCSHPCHWISLEPLAIEPPAQDPPSKALAVHLPEAPGNTIPVTLLVVEPKTHLKNIYIYINVKLHHFSTQNPGWKEREMRIVEIITT